MTPNCSGREGSPVGLGSCICALGAQCTGLMTKAFLGKNISPM